MHIVVDIISLAKLEYEVFPDQRNNLSMNLSVDCQSEFPTPTSLIQTMNFDVMKGVENPPFKLQFSFVSIFRSEGEGSPSLKEFAEANAPAYVMPFARELIFNITSRIGIVPTIILGPVNVYQLMEQGLHVSSVGSSDETKTPEPENL